MYILMADYIFDVVYAVHHNKIHGNSKSCFLVKLQLGKLCLFALICLSSRRRQQRMKEALDPGEKGNKVKVSFTYKRKRQKGNCEIYYGFQNL